MTAKIPVLLRYRETVTDAGTTPVFNDEMPRIAKSRGLHLRRLMFNGKPTVEAEHPMPTPHLAGSLVVAASASSASLIPVPAVGAWGKVELGDVPLLVPVPVSS